MPEFIGRLRTPRLSAAPSSPVAGEVYYDTALAELKFFNSLTWVSIVQPYVLSGIPVSPVDGQEFYYVADATNGIIWHFRYRSASASAYKWEFVGGSPLVAAVITAQTTSSTTQADLATVGPSVTAPLAGDYLIRASAAVWAPAGQSNVVGYYLATSGTGGGVILANGSSLDTTITSALIPITIPVSQAVRLRYNVSGGVNGQFRERRIELLPIRVG